MVLYISETFHKNISNGFQLTERTQVHGINGYIQCSKGNNSKNRQTRVTVHEFCIQTVIYTLTKTLSKYLATIFSV